MLLELQGPTKRPANKNPLVVLILCGLIGGGLFIGNTFASKITLNGSTPIEFGQGTGLTSACDDQITVMPVSTFVNSNESAAFAVTAINFSGIDSSAGACASKDFFIHAYYKNGTSPENFIDSTNEIIVRDSGRSFSVDAISGLVMLSTSNDAFSLTFSTTHTLLDPSRLDTITIESKDHIYSVGSEGPGLGTVFYISDTPFACGPTLSSQCNALEYPPTGVIPTTTARWAPLISATTAVGAGARLTAIGTGYKNSVSIVHQYTEIDGADQSLYQAGVARSFSGGGLNDWYMPSRDELNELYKYTWSNHLGAPMAYGNSSSEVSANSNWGIYFPIANQVPTQTGTKRDTNPSTPIRAFMTARGN